MRRAAQSVGVALGTVWNPASQYVTFALAAGCFTRPSQRGLWAGEIVPVVFVPPLVIDAVPAVAVLNCNVGSC